MLKSELIAKLNEIKGDFEVVFEDNSDIGGSIRITCVSITSRDKWDDCDTSLGKPIITIYG